MADYPLLPTRRRFWERALRAIDKAGKAGVLRTQLKIVHEAARSVADEPLGTVIGGDFVFRSESASMLQSGVLLKEIDELIRGLDDGSADGELKSRIAALVFLISQLPHEGGSDTGVRATAPVIADLLVEDLALDGARLRREVPRILEELVEQGRAMKLGERVPPADRRRRRVDSGLQSAPDRHPSGRSSDVVASQRMAPTGSSTANLRGSSSSKARAKTPRKLSRHWGDDEPKADGGTVPVWIRDEWGVSEAKVREAAAAAGNESPTVFVLLPKIDAEAIADTLGHLRRRDRHHQPDDRSRRPTRAVKPSRECSLGCSKANSGSRGCSGAWSPRPESSRVAGTSSLRHPSGTR